MRVAVALLALVLGIACCAPTTSGAALRVRKEIRRLTASEWRMYVQGVATMLSVSTEQGTLIFGPKYKEMDYFVVKHAYNALNPAQGNPFMADIAHFGPWFMNFHRAFELEFENALLTVVPKLRAMPYWKMYEDMSSGRYYNTSRWIFTPHFTGSAPGDPAYNYAVTDGPFAFREIGHFNFRKYNAVTSVYSGSPIGGLLRGNTNFLDNRYFTRFPAAYQAANNPAGAMAQGLQMSYNRSLFLRCADPNLVRSSWDFISCIDLPTSILNGVTQNGSQAVPWQGTPPGSQHSAFTHGMFHSITGSTGPNNGYVNTTVPFGQIMGDALDLATSPNDVLLFMAHHANIDRLWSIWQKAISVVDPVQATPDVLWHYPKNVTNVPPITINGTALYDVLSPLMPFQDTFPGRIIPGGATHHDVLTWVPNYKYDDLNQA